MRTLARAAFYAALILVSVAPEAFAADGNLVYTTLARPCRIIDTRLAGGRINGSRSFVVAGSTGFLSQGGTSGGCAIPAGVAKAAMINFVAVNPAGLGNFRASSFPNPVPATGSILNYQAVLPPLNVANGLIFPLCDASATTCTSDITVQPNGAGADLVADVLGYYSVSIATPPPPEETRLTYTALAQPCRIVDTRVAGGGRLAPGLPRDFKVAGASGFEGQGGTPGGCGVPSGATVAMINFVAVNAAGSGNLRGSSYPDTIPIIGSVINYQAVNPALNIANGLQFPICDPNISGCFYDMTLEANESATDVVADVLGYFTRPGDIERDMSYTTLAQPCRIIDTRLGAGILSPGTPRDFKVSGTAGFVPQGGTDGGCGVPPGATAAMINFVAVNPTGGGNLKGSSFPNPIPATGNVINYQALNQPLNIANGLLFPMCDPAVAFCEADITLQANNAATHVVADVMGYATKSPCSATALELRRDSAGCEFYPTVTANLVQDTYPFSVAVLNTSDTPTTVTVTRGVYSITTQVVPAGGVSVIDLPWIYQLKSPQFTMFLDSGAYRLRSTQPVIVYQFNTMQPYGETPMFGSGTNDATMLLPAHRWGSSYRVVSYQPPTGNQSFYSVVAREDGTVVSIAGKGVVDRGGLLSEDGSGTVILDAGDVLQVITPRFFEPPVPETWPDPLTGTAVMATKPVQVIGGSSCTNVPAVSYCDHLEEVMLPLTSAALTHVVAAPALPLPQSPNLSRVRIVGREDGTGLTSEPPHPGVPATIDAGQFIEFEHSSAVMISSTRPVVVAEYMIGSGGGEGPDGTGIGDPSMLLTLPPSQWRSQYDFFAPTTWDQSYVNIIAPARATVLLDGSPVTGFVPIGTTPYAVARPLLSNTANGRHTLSSSERFTVSVYGYAAGTSYWYLAGANANFQ